MRRLARAIRRPGPRERREAGLTLIEVVISMAILAVGLVGLLLMQIMAMKATRVGRHVTDAARVAQDQMELLHFQPWAAIPAPGAWSVPVVRNSLDVADAAGIGVAQTYNLSWRVSAFPGDPNLRQLDVRVTGNEPGDPPGTPPRRYAVSSVRHDDPGAP